MLLNICKYVYIYIYRQRERTANKSIPHHKQATFARTTTYKTWTKNLLNFPGFYPSYVPKSICLTQNETLAFQVQISFQFRGAFGDVNVTLHKQALLNCGVCGTEMTVEIGNCKNETAQTALSLPVWNTMVIQNIAFEKAASYQPTRDNHNVYHIICLSSASALMARYESTICGRRDDLMCTMTKLRSGFPGNSGSVLGRKRSFSSSKLPERLWLPPSLLIGGYKSFFPLRKGGQTVKLSTYLYLLSKLRMS